MSSDFILSEMGNHSNGIDIICLLFFKNHGEKPHGAGIEGGLEKLLQ